jgi:hypothetical protein
MGVRFNQSELYVLTGAVLGKGFHAKFLFGKSGNYGFYLLE